MDLNQLAAHGIQISIRDTLKAQGINFKDATKRLDSASDSEGLEFVSTLRNKSRED